MVDPPSEHLHAMFQRMTEQARRALFFARAEVSKWGSAAVEPEHLLLGIIHEGKGPAVTLLRDTFHLEMVALIKEVASHMEHKPKFSTSIEVPFGSSTREVLIAAVEEADRLQHQEMGPEHLLLGILRVADTIPASILLKHEVTLESARESL
jgi:ATP-dependent Clp protease ATP-binding subunit ClpC